MRFEDLLGRWEAGTLSHVEAAAALGVSERTFRRWRGRYAEEGASGLVDRRVGKPSPRRAAEEELQRMLQLYHEHYAGLRDPAFPRQAAAPTWLQTGLHDDPAVAAEERRGRGGAQAGGPPQEAAAPADGRMMLHQDGSRHAWLDGQPALDLVITLDDATSAIYSAFLVEEEGTASTFAAWPR